MRRLPCKKSRTASKLDAMPKAQQALTINGTSIGPGERCRIDLPISEPYGHGRFTLPVVVAHGHQPGSRLFVSAAIHGDEINGVEVIRRLLTMQLERRLRGTLIAVPVVNVYGFLTLSRYLPDRRDLNRSFPGTASGSLASRIARVFTDEIASRATHGIDLHTGSSHRTNLPQIRANVSDAATRAMAEAFRAPVVLDANVRDGSLRQAVLEQGVPMLLYEGGEALRFDELAIRAGVRGILSVMRHLEMLPGRRPRNKAKSVIAHSSSWVRAEESGLLRPSVAIGQRVSKGDGLGIISDPVGDRETRVAAKSGGIVIGKTMLPLVNAGDALFHIASVRRPKAAQQGIASLLEELDPNVYDAPSGEPPIY